MSLQGPSKGIDAMSDDERMKAAQKLNFKVPVSLGLLIQPLASVPNFCLGGRAQQGSRRVTARSIHVCARACVYIY